MKMKMKYKKEKKQYLKERKRLSEIVELKRVIENNGFKRKPIDVLSISDMILNRNKELLRALYSFPKEILLNYKYYVKLNILKKERNDICLLIGGGNSNYLLNRDSLQKFQSNGGKIAAINFWTDNYLLDEIEPNYIINSDPMMFINEDNISDNYNYLKEKLKKLDERILKSKNISIFCPLNQCKLYQNKYPKKEIFGFVDTQIQGLNNNIDPRFPRGYKSLTLYKALAMMIYMNFKKILVIGLDNDYIKKTIVTEDNRILMIDSHVGEKDRIVDFSNDRDSLEDFLYDYLITVASLKPFKLVSENRIFNLDKYSLVDTFEKIKINPNSYIADFNHEKN